MSSAAVQSSGPTISTRQYQQTPLSREQYYSQQSPTALASNSPNTSRKPTRRTSGNGASPNLPTTPQQHSSPPVSNSSNVTTPRAQQPSQSAIAASDAVTAAAYGNATAPLVPPRSSSNQRGPSAANAVSQMENLSLADATPSQQPPRNPSGGGDAGARQSRRSTQQSPREGQNQQQQQQPSSSSNRSKQAPAQAQNRSAASAGKSPSGANITREESTIINRVVASDPQEDIARERARQAEARPQPPGADVTPITGLGLVGSEGVDDGGRGAGKSRQDHSRSDKPRKETRFGEYVLGQTLGEGEFGKVRMGWKKDSSVQVAVKLIRKESLGSNPNRLPKIYREIAILGRLQHPNIVRLHEMAETERHIGIVLEYASGGELFDYILNHRYLKDNAARRLFAQLVSGVGYLHKKGIVHRDLKLENLLLDRNRNIIITDFGFANTFNPVDELTDEIEFNLANKDFVKKMNLEKVGNDGHRRGDLMQTSCGSPCYAAPELVVSDSLYTGRKVDVWSCGVILYAMLAGYLPFDDDPANPEGDNINLLYKYIVSTPLTFPEYVTPHARDLLKRILVPDPRKRADLFEVARHSWLSEFAHVVGFITSTTTTSTDIGDATVTSRKEPLPEIVAESRFANDSAEDPFEAPRLARSASVREPTKPHHSAAPAIGGLQKQERIDQAEADRARAQRDAKRRTVQLEYVAPQSQTARGDSTPTAASASAPVAGVAAATAAAAAGAPRTRARTDNGPTEVASPEQYQPNMSARAQPRPTGGQAALPTQGRSARESQKTTHDSTAFGNVPATSSTRPSTGGSMSGAPRLPSRGNSYGQPSAATVATTNAQGRFSQPKPKQYVISAPIPQQEPVIGEPTAGRPSTQRVSSAHGQDSQYDQPSQGRSHKRSSTVGGFGEKLFGKSNSFFGRASQDQGGAPQKQQRSYPPTSMPASLGTEDSSRKSTESSRRVSFSFGRKNNGSDGSGQRSSRRFSLLPASLSRTLGGGGRDQGGAPGGSYSGDGRRVSSQPRSRGATRPSISHGREESRSASQSTTGSGVPAAGVYDGQHDRRDDGHGSRWDSRPAPTSAPAHQTQYSSATSAAAPARADNLQYPSQPGRDGGYYHTNDSEASQPVVPLGGGGGGGVGGGRGRPQYPPGFNSYEVKVESGGGNGNNKGNVLHKHKKFHDAYEQEGRHGGSGSARRVMDLFRRIGRQRTKEDR